MTSISLQILGYWVYILLQTCSAQSRPDAASYFVPELPGFNKSQQLPVMHSGQIAIDDGEHGGNLFFWHAEAQEITSPGRTVIWLNGGPGCSSMDGMMMEVGPLRVIDDNTVSLNPGSWHKNANLLFIDQPLGVGFSTVSSDRSYLRELDQVAVDLMLFLDRYFEVFPHERLNDIYLTGESYAGQYIPYFANAILSRNSHLSADDPKYIKLQGLALGNPWIDPIRQYLAYMPFSQQRGLVTDGTDLARDLALAHTSCANTLSDLDMNVTVHVPVCETIVSGMLEDYDNANDKGKKCFNIYDVRLTDTFPACGMNWPPDLPKVSRYLARSDVMDALHVARNGPWVECSTKVTQNFLAEKSKPSVDLLPDILAEVPIMIFSGDQDFICNGLGTERMIDSLHWNGALGWTQDVHVDDFIMQGRGDNPVGQVTSHRNLTYVKVFGASHMIPVDDPMIAQTLFYNFVDKREWNQGSANNTIPDSPERDKLINDAMWKAYYQAGVVALIVVVILVGLLVFFVFRRRETTGVHFGDNETPIIGDIIKSFFSGLSRWKPTKVFRRNRYRGLDDLADEEELAEFEMAEEYEDDETSASDL